MMNKTQEEALDQEEALTICRTKSKKKLYDYFYL